MPKVNGQYITTQDGYLEIKAANGDYVAIDSMNSDEQGQPDNVPPTPATNLGFSAYFHLNDFFQAPDPATGASTTAGSAINLAVQQRLVNDPSLISMGNLVATPDPSGVNPTYAYERDVSDNSVIQNLAGIQSLVLNFPAIGGLGATSQTLSDYAGQVIGSASSQAATAQTNDTNANTLLTGYQQQESSISGVNLDTELANTIIYQNAYTASARVITVVNDLFSTLLQTFEG